MELQDFIAESNGISLHRRRVLTAFSHVSDGPLIDMLFNLTRPAIRSKAKLSTLHAPSAERTLPASTIVRKGMVNYRREFLGVNDSAE